MKIRLVGGELLLSNGQTDRNGETYCPILQFCARAYKLTLI